MINGIHTILYAKEDDKVRSFFRDVLNLPCVDAGGGWLIFALPPGELGIHPVENDEFRSEMYLMCDDLEKTIQELRSKGVGCGEPQDQGWGIVTSVSVPGGGKLGLYQPRHPQPSQWRPSSESSALLDSRE